MSDRLYGLSDEERVACRIAERTLGVVATAHDVPPIQGAVDALLAYADGRTAAFEVTRLATDGGASYQLARLLDGQHRSWPLPGKWWWTVQIAHPRDLPKLRTIFDKVVTICEALGVTRPEQLHIVDVDADIRWLTSESSVKMIGHPTIPAVDGTQVRRAMITQPGAAGFVDNTFRQLDEVLADVFRRTPIQRHVSKLDDTIADERHLFVIVNLYDLPFSLFDAIGTSDSLPADPPVLPSALTHLWLAPVYGQRVLIGGSSGWTESRHIR